MRNEKPKQNKYNKSGETRPTPGRPTSGRSASGKSSAGQSHTTRPREKGVEKSVKDRPIQQASPGRADSFLDELKNDLMAFFQINDEQSFTQEQILDHFGTSDRRMKLIINLKNDLMAFFQINDEQSFTQEQILDHFGTSDRRMNSSCTA